MRNETLLCTSKVFQGDIYAYEGILKQFSAIFLGHVCCCPTQLNRDWRLTRNMPKFKRSYLALNPFFFEINDITVVEGLFYTSNCMLTRPDFPHQACNLCARC